MQARGTRGAPDTALPGHLGCIADVPARILRHAVRFGLELRRGKHRRSTGWRQSSLEIGCEASPSGEGRLVGL